MNYSILKPRKGYVVIKELEDKNEKVLIKSGNDESRAMGRVVCLPEDSDYKLKIDDLVIYNEYEGQELFKYGSLINEDHIIVIKESDILLWIDEFSNAQNNVSTVPKEPKEGTSSEVKKS